MNADKLSVLCGAGMVLEDQGGRIVALAKDINEGLAASVSPLDVAEDIDRLIRHAIQLKAEVLR